MIVYSFEHANKASISLVYYSKVCIYCKQIYFRSQGLETMFRLMTDINKSFKFLLKYARQMHNE